MFKRKKLIGICVSALILATAGMTACKPKENKPDPVEPDNPDKPREVVTYIDENFDDLNVGDSLEDNTNVFEYYEGGGFVASSKDADGNVWIRAKDVNEGSQWALAYTNIYKNNIKTYLKDFCVEFDTRIPAGTQLTADADGGACVLWSPQAGRYDLAVHYDKATYGASNNHIDLWHAMNTDGGPFATTVNNPDWGDRGSVVEKFTFSAGVSYTISICGKYQGIDEDGNEFFTLYVFVDDALVIYQRDIVYWDGGFGLRGFISPYEYANFKVSDFPKVCPDGIDHYTVDTAETEYTADEFNQIPAPAPTIEGKKVHWQAVNGASGYSVFMNGQFLAHTDKTEYDFSDTYFDSAEIAVTAFPDKFGANASAPATVTASNPATQLAAPELTMENDVISWGAVENAVKYEIYSNGEKIAEQTGLVFRPMNTSFFPQAGTYEITVKAISGDARFKDSALSSGVQYVLSSGLNLSDVKISGRVVSWTGDSRATGYEITVNGVMQTITETSYTLPDDGDYTITVRAVDSTGAVKASEPVTVYTGKTITLDVPEITYKNGKIYWQAQPVATKYEIYRNGVKYDETTANEYKWDKLGVYAVKAIGNGALVSDSALSSDFTATAAPVNGYFLDATMSPGVDTLDLTSTQQVGDVAQIGWNLAQYVIREIAEDGTRFFGSAPGDVGAYKESFFQCKNLAEDTYVNFESWTMKAHIKPLSTTGGRLQFYIGTAAVGGRYAVVVNPADGGAVEVWRNDFIGKSYDANMGGKDTLGANKKVQIEMNKVSEITLSHAKLEGDKGLLSVFVNGVCVLQCELANMAVGDWGLVREAGMDVLFGGITVTSLDMGADGTYTGVPIKLAAPALTLAESTLSWTCEGEYIFGYEVYLDGSLYATLSADKTSFDVTEDGNYTVRAIGNGTTVLASEFAVLN